MYDHAPRAVGNIGLVGCWCVRPQDREQSVLTWLRQIKAFRFLLCRGGYCRDILQFPQTPRCGLVARILALLHPLQTLAELTIDAGRPRTTRPSRLPRGPPP